MSSPSLLPSVIDNRYLGQRIALWIFGLAVGLKVVMSANSIFNGRSVARYADGLPLDSYSPAAAQTIVALIAIFGLGHVVLCTLCLLVLVRYRSLIPFMFGILLVELLSRRVILQLLPIVRIGTPPGSAMNLFLLALMLAGLGLSVWNRANIRTADSPEAIR